MGHGLPGSTQGSMNCRLCGDEITLIPSAKERATKYGGSPSYYTNLFKTHAHCAVADRSRQARELMGRITCHTPNPSAGPR